MAESSTPEDILNAYILMWREGCKGGTIYRDGSRSNQVLKTHDDEGVLEVYAGLTEPSAKAPVQSGWRDEVPSTTETSIRHKFQVGEVEGYLHVGRYPDGQPSEMFLDISRAGSTVDGLTKWTAQTISLFLQMAHKHGVPFTVMTDKWLNRSFEPAGRTTNNEIPFATSIPDYLGRWLEDTFSVATVQRPPVQRGELCPDCGAMLVFQENCSHCIVCGFERC